ncbi:hypothetical protein A1O1_05396 [Capronia coronata CBS 617.96]|uniref:Symplekin/Pta1 N-terminal domain-containing protein n=1 Tax=Capronia coronata CBS 617.96 TaxID=1182541 RepID=W9YGT2_9EURO|nr:uncharacterized protein A1O1_05396 [Capronia coronata CBS 617.96]EXJ88466.1 hypothetical protein A1O1_05396 [Capronia coronata CBS 617.96]
MAGATTSAAEMISQLEAARKLALADSQVYNQVLPGILPIIGPAAHIEVRRWGADFLAEAFASPSLSNAQKEQLSPEVMPTLRAMLEGPGEDLEVIKSVVQAAASLYPLVFRRIISHPNEIALWQDMTSMKLNILQRMDSFPVPIRICCIKFVQKVVHVETPGVIADPRRPDQNETSIALVPRNHPLLQLQNLEAEASGLLDRLLSIFQENSIDPIVVDATLNCLAILIKTRPSISTKIVSAILNFNPFKQANSPMTPRLMVIVRSMERTTRALLRWVLRSVPNHPLEPKIQAYLMRLQQSRSTLFSDSTAQKRPAEPTDGLDDAKRQRLSGPRKFPPMPPPPNSVAQLFTLTEDPALQQFDVSLLPADIVSTVTAVFLQHLDSNSLDEAVNAIRARYTHLQKASQPTPVPDVPMAGPTGIDDDDDYDPEFLTSGEMVVEATTEKALEELAQPAIDLGPFELPKPPPLTGTEVAVLSDQTVGHVFQLVASLEAAGQTHAKQKLGLNRLAASTNDRDSWVTILMRLATRAPAGLDDVVAALTGDAESNQIVKSEETEERNVANRIRQTLFMYILDDFRPRLNVAISWLSEEWYADKMTAKTHPELGHLPNYTRWVHRLIDRLLPYLDARDKNLLIRFLSEIPAIDRDILDRVKSLARDPERISMCILAMQYLLMMRPPVRDIVLDTIESIWYDGDAQAKNATAKVLAKWRPGFLDQAGQPKKEEGTQEETKPNGLKSPPTSKADVVDPRKRMVQAAVAAGHG